MHKIDLMPYTILIVEPTTDGKGLKRSEYPMEDPRMGLAYLMTLPAFQQSGDTTLWSYQLAATVQAAHESLLLEDADWQKLCNGIHTVQGLGHFWAPLLDRILNAPIVMVKEAI